MDTPETVRLVGNSLCLDFANSVDWSVEGEPVKDEVLGTAADLRRWGLRLGLGDSKKPGGDELARALDLRGPLHVAFAAIAHGDEPAAKHLRTISDHHAEAAQAARIKRAPDGAYRLAWPRGDARRVRFAVVADAVALLADP